MTHICVSKLTIISSDNGLSPGRRQAIIWTNAGILSIGPLKQTSVKFYSKIKQFHWKKIHLKMSCAKSRPFCLGLNVLTGKYQHFYFLGLVRDSVFHNECLEAQSESRTISMQCPECVLNIKIKAPPNLNLVILQSPHWSHGGLGEHSWHRNQHGCHKAGNIFWNIFER